MVSCPQCDSECVHQSRRKGFLEKGPFAMISFRPYRCEICDLRFFRWTFAGTPSSARSRLFNSRNILSRIPFHSGSRK
jgi:hypothetical protein